MHTPTIDVVRCEHAHGTGTAHPLAADCVYPHIVGKAVAVALPREDVEKIRKHLTRRLHSGAAMGEVAYAELEGLLRRLP